MSWVVAPGENGRSGHSCRSVAPVASVFPSGEQDQSAERLSCPVSPPPHKIPVRLLAFMPFLAQHSSLAHPDSGWLPHAIPATFRAATGLQLEVSLPCAGRPHHLLSGLTVCPPCLPAAADCDRCSDKCGLCGVAFVTRPSGSATLSFVSL